MIRLYRSLIGFCLGSILGFSALPLAVSGTALAQEKREISPLSPPSLRISEYNCCGLDSATDEPIDELRQALLATALSSARVIDHPAQKIEALLLIAESYAYIGQKDSAKAIGDEVLIAIDEIAIISSRILSSRISAIARLSRLYIRLDDADSAKHLLKEAVRLTETEPKDSRQRFALFTQIFFEYGKLREYETIREIIDSIDDSELKELLIKTSVSQIYYFSAEEDQPRIKAIFPELFIPEAELTKTTAGREENSLELWLFELPRQVLEGGRFNEPDDLTAFLAEQISTIESFAKGYSRSFAYLELWRAVTTRTQFLGIPQDNALLERAVQAYESVNSPSESVEQGGYRLSARHISRALGVALMSIGETERGSTFIEEAITLSESTPDQPFILLDTARELTEQKYSTAVSEVVNETINKLLVKAEESVRSDEENLLPTLVNIAQAYVDIEDIESARRIIDNLLVADQDSALVSSDQHYALALIVLMIQVNSQGSVTELVALLDENTKAELPGQLIAVGEDQLAFQILEMLESPARQAYALLDVAAEYNFTEETENSEIVFELLTQALTIAQSEALSQDDYLRKVAQLYQRP